MPIDPFVQQILNTPPAQTPDYVARRMKLRDLAQQGRLREQEIAQAELVNAAGRMQADELKRFNEAVGRGATGEELFRASPALATKMSESQANLRKTELENQQAQSTLDEKTRGILRGSIFAVRGVPPEQRAARYAAERNALLATGLFSPGQLSEQAPDEEALNAYAFFAMDAAERQALLDQAEEARRNAAVEVRAQTEHDATIGGKQAESEQKQIIAGQVKELGMTKAEHDRLEQPAGDLREFKQVFLPGYYQAKGITQPSAADELAAYKEWKQGQRVPGVDVPLPEAVEAQRRRMNASRAAANGLSPQQFSQTQVLARALDNQPAIKDFNTTAAKAETVKRILDRQLGGPGDLAVVYEFMKGLDPTSVVRETEYASAAQSGNIFAGPMERFNGYLRPEGGFLPPAVKSGFMSVLNEKLNVSKRQVKGIYNDYARRIDVITKQPGTGAQYLTDYTAILGDDAAAAGSVQVSAGGKTYTFPNQAAADAFKSEAGIK